MRDWVDFVVGVTPEDLLLRPSTLDRETHVVKFNVNTVVASKFLDINEVFYEVGTDKNVTEDKRVVVGG